MAEARIVVGVDGSDASRRAVRCAAVLGELTGAEVVAVHAIGLLEERHGPDDEPGAWRRKLAEVVEHTWAAPLAGARCPSRVEMEDGAADDVLLRVARREAAELLVVGSRAVLDPDRALGSTSLRVVQTAPLPVLVVPPFDGDGGAGGRAGGDPGTWPVDVVVVGVDASPASDAALDRAVDVAARSGAALRIVEVVAGAPDVATATARLDAAAAAARDRGVAAADVVVPVGDPAAELAAQADAAHAGLVVVGTRGRRGPDEVLGSVARSVVNRLRRPTLVVPLG
jgi:nucleotide-binding universal stress UspA family protein